MISGAQVRAARGLLGWARHELARRAIVSDATTYALENAKGSAANVDAMAAVQVTLEAEVSSFSTATRQACGCIRKCRSEFQTGPPTDTAIGDRR
jgi:transcriptional regulator with XRE-family HTH domain